MAEYEWRDSDARDVVRRDMVQLLQRGSPGIAASSAIALWLRSTAPSWAAVFLGMSVAWILSMVFEARQLRGRWRALKVGLMRVEFGSEGLTVIAPWGPGLLKWGAFQTRRLGDTWLLVVNGQESGILPHRCLSADEARLLTEQVAVKAKR